MWVKLKLSDNWGYLYYHFNKKKVKFNKEITVRWPDGTESTHLIHMQSYSDRVYDHGKYYPVNGEIEIIKVDFLGVLIEVRLDKVEIWFEEEGISCELK